MSPVSRVHLPDDGASVWAGMADLVLVLPSGQELEAPYVGEPPHGDSFHALTINGARLPGHVWGSRFAAAPDGRYLAVQWMRKMYERQTLVIDIEARRYLVLPTPVQDFRFDGVVLRGDGRSFDVEDSDGWIAF
ncbi:MAG: hypothetical protein REJ23_09680 [Brevundimonas sp.]|nr:hypothetical protein [Brevundimonas sp.]